MLTTVLLAKKYSSLTSLIEELFQCLLCKGLLEISTRVHCDPWRLNSFYGRRRLTGVLVNFVPMSIEDLQKVKFLCNQSQFSLFIL